MWGKRGEAVAQYLTKGKTVAVRGTLGSREHDGKTYLDLDADELELLGGGSSQSDSRPSGGIPF